MDLFISLAVFIILITILTLTWDLYHIRLTKRFDYDDMVIKTLQLSDTMLKTAGEPSYWKNSTVKIVGLANNEREIDPDKLSELVAMDDGLDNDHFRNLMHIPLYDIYIVVKQLNVGGQATALATFGDIPSAKYTVNLIRYAKYRGVDVSFEVSLSQ